MKIIENQKFDEERALYGSSELLVRNCSFVDRQMEKVPLKNVVRLK